jgi:hypothetical protein
VGIGGLGGCDIYNIVRQYRETALYHFSGERHTFNAHVYVTQDNVAHTAAITGRVTDGWLKGARVTGEYTVWAICPIPTPGNGAGTLCFQGVLHIQKDGGDERSTVFQEGGEK